MGSAAAVLDAAGIWVVRVSLQAAVLALLVAAAQWALRGRLPARWRHALWWLVVLRLALPPGLPATPISVFNLAALPVPSPGGDVEPPRPAPAAAREALEAPAAPTWEEELLAGSDLAGATLPASGRGTAPIPAAGPWAPASSPSGWGAVGLAWAAGCAAMLAWQAVAAWRWRRRERGMRRAESGPAAELLRRCAAEMGLAPGSAPALLVGDGIGAPALAGWWRPRVLLPPGVLATLRPRELRLVLLHELAHVRRRDVLVGRLLGALAAIHWFNPVVRWALERMRQEAEAACDERVLAVAGRSGEDARIEYGSAMLAVVEWLSGSAPAPPGAGGSPGVVGILGGRHLLKRRITMIARYDGGERRRRAGTAWAMAAAVLLAAVGLTEGVRGQAGTGSSSAAAGAPGRGDGAAGTNAPSTRPGTGIGRGSPPNTGGMRPAPEMASPGRYPSGPGGPPGRFPAPGGTGTMGGAGATGMGPGWPTAPPRRPTAFLGSASSDPRNARVLEALRKELPEAKFDGVALGDVIDFLRDATGVNVFVDWRELEAAGIERQAPVTLSVRDVQAGEVLRLALRSASRQLTARLQGGVVEIGVHGDVAAGEAELLTRAYDVADLVGMAPAARGRAARAAAAAPAEAEVENARVELAKAEAELRELSARGLGDRHPSLRAAQAKADAARSSLARFQMLREEAAVAAGAMAPGGGGLGDTGGGAMPGAAGGGMYGGGFDPRGGGGPADPISAKMMQLSEIIRETVAPDTWRDTGGEEGSIRFFGTKLLIRATEARHQEVEKLLAMLREE